MSEFVLLRQSTGDFNVKPSFNMSENGEFEAMIAPLKTISATGASFEPSLQGRYNAFMSPIGHESMRDKSWASGRGEIFEQDDSIYAAGRINMNDPEAVQVKQRMEFFGDLLGFSIGTLPTKTKNLSFRNAVQAGLSLSERSAAYMKQMKVRSVEQILEHQPSEFSPTFVPALEGTRMLSLNEIEEDVEEIVETSPFTLQSLDVRDLILELERREYDFASYVKAMEAYKKLSVAS